MGGNVARKARGRGGIGSQVDPIARRARDLRRIGLGGSLVRRDDGYLVDPKVLVVRES